MNEDRDCVGRLIDTDQAFLENDPKLTRVSDKVKGTPLCYDLTCGVVRAVLSLNTNKSSGKMLQLSVRRSQVVHDVGSRNVDKMNLSIDPGCASMSTRTSSRFHRMTLGI